MSGFVLHGDGDHGHTLVPNLFLDNYMPEANGEYVKIYLYLLRCLKSDTQELSIELIANKFENTESDVRRALKYWERMKLLKLQYDNSQNLTGIQIVNEPEAGNAKTETQTPLASQSVAAIGQTAAAAQTAAGENTTPVSTFPRTSAREGSIESVYSTAFWITPPATSMPSWAPPQEKRTFGPCQANAGS